MKIESLLTENLKDNKEAMKDIVYMIKDLKKETEDDKLKDKIDRVLDKIRTLRDNMPNSELSYLGTIFSKVLSLPLKFFGI